jgi:hypothetical protein
VDEKKGIENRKSMDVKRSMGHESHGGEARGEEREGRYESIEGG